MIYDQYVNVQTYLYFKLKKNYLNKMENLLSSYLSNIRSILSDNFFFNVYIVILVFILIIFQYINIS